jgi:glycosyltransferase involved in cell wall biosynthesis
MDISLLILVHNQPDTLEWLLRSLELQDFTGNWEVIVTDDGSDSRIYDIVAKVPKSIADRLRFVWQPHDQPRMSRARNNAIRLAQGDVLVFVDADMVVTPDFLRRHAQAHSKPRRLVSGRRSWVFLGDQRPARNASAEECLDFLSARSEEIEGVIQVALAASKDPWMACVSCNFSVPRSSEIWFDEHFVGWGLEDRELACRLANRCGYEVIHSPLTRGYHVLLKSREEWVARRPVTTHEEITRYLYNMLYLRSLYPDVDLSILTLNLGRFVLQEDANQWCTVPVGRGPLLSSDETLSRAKQWFTGAGSHWAPVKEQ